MEAKCDMVMMHEFCEDQPSGHSIPTKIHSVGFHLSCVSIIFSELHPLVNFI